MTIGKESESFEDSSEDLSRNATLIVAGPSVEISEQNEDSLSTGSCSAVLEPSEDEPLLYERQKIRRPYKKYRAAIMKSYNSTEININSDELSTEEENVQQTCRVPSVCSLWNWWSNFAVKVRNSKMIYFLQFSLFLQVLSVVVMGAVYTNSCPGSPSLTTLTSLTGILATLLVVQWVAITCCGPDDRPCAGQQKFLILFFFVLVVALLEFEIYIYSQLAPSFVPSSPDYCSKAFYYFTYYKFMFAFGAMFQVVMLYFPSCWSFASGLECSDPVAGNCYRAAMEESQ